MTWAWLARQEVSTKSLNAADRTTKGTARAALRLRAWQNQAVGPCVRVVSMLPVLNSESGSGGVSDRIPLLLQMLQGRKAPRSAYAYGPAKCRLPWRHSSTPRGGLGPTVAVTKDPPEPIRNNPKGRAKHNDDNTHEHDLQGKQLDAKGDEQTAKLNKLSQNLYSPNQSVARGGDVVVVVKAQVERY